MTLATLAAAIVLSATPVRTAETVPRGVTVLHMDGGLALVRVALPSLPFFPIPSGDLEIAHGIVPGLDVRGRYTTYLGVAHRLGPELRVRALQVGVFSLGARLFPSAYVVGAAHNGVDVAGDVSTQAALLATVRGAPGALTLDAGATVQWVQFASLRGMQRVDASPYLAFVDLALEAERPISPGANLTLRLELGISLTPNDPFAFFGLYPRLLFGGNFRL